MPVVAEVMGEAYANLLTDWARIPQVAFAEEDAFRKTLENGMQIFDTFRDRGEAVARARPCPGERAFTLHDTYGIPIEVTESWPPTRTSRSTSRASAA